jgi:L-ascorbate metabolism protein UlaG (beta-lactamase superfamily)
MKITYLGHSAFILEDESFKAIIDPFISGNSMSNIEVDEITNLTHIFVTHGHGDHLGDTIPLAKSNDALVISNAEISNYLSSKGIKTHSMHIGGRYKFNFGTVKLTPALHGSAISTEKGPVDGGNPCGFIIEVNGRRVYHAGDTGLTMDMKLLEADDIDVALIPIGGNYTMDIDDAIRAVDFIKPKLVIPMHYDTFPVIKADPNEFKEKNNICKTKIMEIGETYEL